MVLSASKLVITRSDVSSACACIDGRVAAPTIDYDAKFKSAQQLKAGASLFIPVKIGGVPAPKVEWTLKDEPLAPSSTVIIETTEGQSTLTLKSLTGRSTGKVKVTATNVVGKASAEFDVTVKGIGMSDFAELFDFFPRFTWILGIILAFLRSPSYLISRALTMCDYGFEPSPALFLASLPRYRRHGHDNFYEQESPADAGIPARRKTMKKIPPFRSYNKFQSSGKSGVYIN